mgnify:CR=1 FL=1
MTKTFSPATLLIRTTATQIKRSDVKQTLTAMRLRHDFTDGRDRARRFRSRQGAGASEYNV